MNERYPDKLKELILYVLSCPSYKEGGIKKLNKLLYFIDFYYYRDHEKLISGAQYAKADMGPVLDKYQIIFESLIEDNILKRQDEDGKKIYKPATHYNLSSFNPDEIDHITKVLDKYGKLSPSELESISHDQQPWMLTENYGDIIDPDLALLIDSGDEPESKIVENDRLKTELEQLANSIAN